MLAPCIMLSFVPLTGAEDLHLRVVHYAVAHQREEGQVVPEQRAAQGAGPAAERLADSAVIGAKARLVLDFELRPAGAE